MNVKSGMMSGMNMAMPPPPMYPPLGVTAPFGAGIGMFYSQPTSQVSQSQQSTLTQPRSNSQHNGIDVLSQSLSQNTQGGMYSQPNDNEGLKTQNQ